MKKYKKILILLFIALSFPIIPILTSCSNNNKNNVNFYIKSSIGDNICFQNDNVELSVVSNLENLESYQFSWECPQLNNYEFSNSFVINFPTNEIGQFDVKVYIYQNNNVIASLSYKLIVNKRESTPEYNLVLKCDNKINYYGENVTIVSSLESYNNFIPDNLKYRWYLNDEYLNNLDTSSITLSTMKVGKNVVKLMVYDNDVMLSENSIEISILEKDNNKLNIPTTEELHINSDVRTDYFYSDFCLSSSQFKTKFNDYGLLNSLSLLAYMLCDSNDFINSNSYNNIELKLLKNNNYNVIQIEISANVKTNVESINNVGKKLPFSSISESFDGVNLISGDQIKLNFEIVRSNSNLSSYGQDKIEPSNIFIGTTLQDLFIWNKIGVPVKLAYTSNEFVVNTKLYKNNSLVKSGTDNRCFIPFIYYATRECYPASSGYFLGQINCVK